MREVITTSSGFANEKLYTALCTDIGMVFLLAMSE
jgi:hypothetical protein